MHDVRSPADSDNVAEWRSACIRALQAPASVADGVIDNVQRVEVVSMS